MMEDHDLPAGWTTCALGDLIPKPRPKVAPNPRSELPFIGMDHIEAESFSLTGQARFGDMKSAGSYFLPDDVLYGRLRPYLNKVHRAKFEGVASAEFIVLPSDEHFDSDFIKLLLHQRSFVDFAMSKSSGDRPRVKFNGIATYEFALPPLREQQRIVEKVETLFAELDKGEEAVRQVQKLLARYRQSVMKAAVTGELTADWRAANGAQQESGKDLLARILKQRRENWQGRGRYKEPLKPNTEALPELPHGWVWTSLEALADHYSNAIIDGPFGSKLKTEHYRDEGVRVIRLENIGDGKFRDKRTFISPEHANELERHSIRGGDIAIASLGDELPRACMIPLSIENAIVKADCIRFSPYRACVDVTFVLTWLNSWLLRHRVGAEIRGVGRPRLNLRDIRAFPVPLPSFEEQREISDRVISAEARIAASISWTRTELDRSAALRQSILKDAFSGKLVPQDPSDEPAEKLLERILAARLPDPSAKRKKAAA